MFISKQQRKQQKQKEHEPKVVENAKQSLHYYGNTKCSQIIRNVLQDFHTLRKPLSTVVKDVNKLGGKSPFEDVLALERESKKQDASLFTVGSHSKKRPHNLVMGRMYDHQVLDMVEFGVTDYCPMQKSARDVSVLDGSKPCLLFQGDAFANDDGAQRTMNLMLDFFRGDATAKTVNILGLDHVVVITALSEEVFLFDHCAVKLSKSGTAIPKVDLQSIGPSMTLTVRRTQFATEEKWKEAIRIPQQLRPSSTRNKNILVNEVTGEREGRIHMEQQPINTISLRRFKSLNKKNRISAEDGGDLEGDDVARLDMDELHAMRSSKRQKTLTQGPSLGLMEGRNKNRPMQAKNAMQETMAEFQ